MFLGEVISQASGVDPKGSTAMFFVIVYLSLVSGRLSPLRPIQQLLHYLPREPVTTVEPLRIREQALKTAVEECNQDGILKILEDMERALPDPFELVSNSGSGPSDASHSRQILQILEQQWHALSAVVKRRSINSFIRYRYYEPLQSIVSEGDVSLALFTLEAVVANRQLVGGEIALSIIGKGISHSYFDVWSRSYDLFFDLIDFWYGLEKIRELLTSEMYRADRERVLYLFEIANRHLNQADVEEVTEAALRNPDRGVRFQVLELLANEGTSSARKSLIRAMGHSDLETQEYAAELWRSL
jgi:hypothetical protein